MTPFVWQYGNYLWTNLDSVGAQLTLCLLQPGGGPTANAASEVVAAAKARIADAFAEFRDSFCRDNGHFASFSGFSQRHTAEASRLPDLRQQETDLQTEIRHQLAQDGDPIGFEKRLDTVRAEIARIESRVQVLLALRDDMERTAERDWHEAVRAFTARLRQQCGQEAQRQQAAFLDRFNDQVEPLLTALQTVVLAAERQPVDTAFPAAV